MQTKIFTTADAATITAGKLSMLGSFDHLWHLCGLPLPKPRVFYIDAIMDGSLLARTPLFVKQGSQP